MLTEIVSIMLAAHAAFLQKSGDSFIEAVMRITGAVSEESLSEDEMERFRWLALHPLDINLSSGSDKLASGLFSPYQVAVMEDSRSRSGDILSFAELAALDGFGEDFVAALSHFVCIVPNASPGNSSSYRSPPSHETTFRSGVRHEEGDAAVLGMYGMKYRFSSAGGMAEAGIALRSSWDEPHLPPSDRTFFVAVRSRNGAFRGVFGDYNLKFGQGLALWSGFSMSGSGLPASFSRNPSGIVPYGSYSGEGTFRGMAGEYRKGRFVASAFLGGEGLRSIAEKREEISFIPGVNLLYYGHSGQASVTGIAMTDGLSPGLSLFRLSADARYCVKGTDLFTEIACDGISSAVAALAGARFAVSPTAEAAVAARYYPAEYDGTFAGALRSGSKCSNEHGVMASFRHLSERRVQLCGRTGFGSSVNLSDLTVDADASWSPAPKYGTDTSSFQVRAGIAENLRISPMLGLKLRFSGRYRTYSRPLKLNMRTEFEFTSGEWLAKLRTDAAWCRAMAYLGYCEGGYKSEMLSVYLRAGIFRVDNWDDRIYVYERDAPGNFSVPAYYGRGYWLALTGGIRVFRGGKLHLRASFVDYPWLRPAEKTKKSGRAELKIQFTFRLFGRSRF